LLARRKLRDLVPLGSECSYTYGRPFVAAAADGVAADLKMGGAVCDQPFHEQFILRQKDGL